jgi:hypothetical protein
MRFQLMLTRAAEQFRTVMVSRRYTHAWLGERCAMLLKKYGENRHMHTGCAQSIAALQRDQLIPVH